MDRVLAWLKPLTVFGLVYSHSFMAPPRPNRDSTSNYKINYVIVILKFLNPEGHQNPISGSKVTAILLKGWILPIGRGSSGRICVCSLRSRLVFKYIQEKIVKLIKFSSNYAVCWTLKTKSTCFLLDSKN